MGKASRSKKKALARKRREARQRLQTAVGAVVVLVIVAIALVVILSSGGGAGAVGEISQSADGSWEFVLSDLDGNAVHLSDYRGKVVLLNLWATWCPPCAREMPGLQSFYSAYHDEGFELLAINDRESAAQIRAFADSLGVTFPILMDQTGNVIRAFRIEGLPTSILLDQDGREVARWSGMVRPSMLEERVLPLLGLAEGPTSTPLPPNDEIIWQDDSGAWDFELNTVDGETVRLSDHRGKVVLVNIWATWCLPCVREMPELQDFYDDHADDGFVLLAVNARESHTLVDTFRREHDLHIPILMDPSGAVIEAFGVTSFPTSVVLDRDGREVDRWEGIIQPGQLEERVLPLIEAG